jgi:hypothetical protein
VEVAFNAEEREKGENHEMGHSILGCYALPGSGATGIGVGRGTSDVQVQHENLGPGEI